MLSKLPAHLKNFSTSISKFSFSADSEKNISYLIKPGGRFVAIEDIRTGDILNRFGIWLDQGDFIRTEAGWENLLGPRILRKRYVNLSPFWPVPKMAMLIKL